MRKMALEYLMKNPLLHMGIIEAIRRNTAAILYSGLDGVFIQEEKSNAYMLSVSNFHIGKKLIDTIPKCNLIAVYQEYMVDYICKKFKLLEQLECFQAVYMNKDKLNVSDKLEIRPLEKNQLGLVLEHYDKLSSNELKSLIINRNLFGGYRDGVLIGFIGTHLEGSLGILEIFPKYRKLGYGTILESYMVNQMLEKGLTPFSQIEVNNQKSLALQDKLGFSISKDKLYWMF